jgi:hypothetical protein
LAKAAKPVIGQCPTPGCGEPVPIDHPYSWCIRCGEPLPDTILSRIQRPSIEPARPNRFYEATVRNPTWNFAVLGILGLLGLYSGASGVLKRGEGWSGGLTMGVLAVICAVQGLTKAPRAAVICSWRILLTFYGISLILEILGTDFDGQIELTVVKGMLVVVCAIFVFPGIWRKGYVGPWGSDTET